MNEQSMQAVTNSSLFEGMTRRDIGGLLSRLHLKQIAFDKNEFIIRAGERVQSLGLLLSGAAYVLKEDFWGERTFLSVLQPGDVFAEEYAMLPDAPLETSVMGAVSGSALFLNTVEIFQNVQDDMSSRLAGNLMSILARKNLLLSRQAEILSKRTIRERLISYLSAEAFHRGLSAFEIPFSRQELADHLSVDRCALCTEISKMKQEGIIDTERRTFVMLRDREDS